MKHPFIDRRLPWLLLIILLIFTAVKWFELTERLPTGADTQGYVYAGKQIASGQGLFFEDSHNQSAGPYFSPFAFQIRRTEDSRLFFGFPPGFPILLAIGPLLTGQIETIHLVAPFWALVGVVVTFFLGRHISQDEWGGFLSAAIVALSPDYWWFGTAAWSEIPTMVLGTLGTLLFLLSRQSKRKHSQKLWLSFLSACLLIFSVYIRYANITLFPAFALYELITARKKLFAERWRYLFFFVLGLGVASTLLFNNWYYGGPFLTNYSPENGWYPTPAFSFSYAINESKKEGGSLLAIIKTLWANFPFIVLLLPFGWRWMKRPLAWLTATMVITTVALYSVYAFVASGTNSRFLLPIYPFIAVAIAIALLHFGKMLPRIQYKVISILALMLLLFWSVPAQNQSLQIRNQHHRDYVTRIKELVAFSPPDAVFLSYANNDGIIFYGERSVLNYRRIPPSDGELGRYRLEELEPCLVQTVNRLLAQNKPVYFIEDGNPTYWNTLDVVRENYELVVMQEPPKIYQINSATPLEQTLDKCHQ